MSKEKNKKEITEVTEIKPAEKIAEKMKSSQLEEKVTQLEKEKAALNEQLRNLQALVEKLKNVIVQKDLNALDGAVARQRAVASK